MSVEASWHRVVTWLTVYAPQTASVIRPPAGGDTLRRVEGMFRHPWPEDLRQWYRLHDGAKSPTLFTGVLPGYAELLSLEQIPEASRAYLDSSDELDDSVFGDAMALEQSPAGEVAGRFLPSWVPIAEDGTACTMFVDCRGGAHHGCVTLFEREDADSEGPTWTSIEAMLTDLADAIEGGRPCGGWQPHAEGGVLEWEPADY